MESEKLERAMEELKQQGIPYCKISVRTKERKIKEVPESLIKGMILKIEELEERLIRLEK